MADLSPQAEMIAKKRYYLKDKEGEPVEDSTALFRRVAEAIGSVEKRYGKLDVDAKLTTDQFFHMMNDLKFIPNSPTLMNAGTHQGTLSACFVLPIEDTMEGIMKAATDSALVQKFGGGTGFALSKLRPAGANIASTHGVACGPIEVLKTLSRISSMITQGGKRDGANMAILDIHHPDILEFITCKSREGDFHNFNISVGVDDAFMQAVKAGTHYPLIDPNTNQIMGELNARAVFDQIVLGAWANGEPGMVFLDRINRDNTVDAEYGRMIATNPCGEQPLLPNESCNLGSINLSKFFTILPEVYDPAHQLKSEWRDLIDWNSLKETAQLATRFLDNVIDANYYATVEIEQMTKATRKIGLGVMGFSDLLLQLRVGYNTSKGREIGREVMKFIQEVADETSIELATERGEFPAWGRSEYAEKNIHIRNACRLSVAPTGTISMLADSASGIEPMFALAWKKQNVLEGEDFYYVNKYFEQLAKDFDFYTEELIGHISEGGSIQDREEVPDWVKEVYITVSDMLGEDHILMQAAFQKYCDAGISKTINFPAEAALEDVEEAYMEAWRNDCKGVTVYRAGSREKEVLVSSVADTSGTVAFDLPVDMELDFTEDGKPQAARQLAMVAIGENNAAKLAPLYEESPDTLQWIELQENCCDDPFLVEESGCTSCKNCGWSKCHIA